MKGFLSLAALAGTCATAGKFAPCYFILFF
jgi:hypothetical protein